MLPARRMALITSLCVPFQEDKQRWIDDYKKAMEPQDQLPLLFQTMTVRASPPCKPKPLLNSEGEPGSKQTPQPGLTPAPA